MKGLSLAEVLVVVSISAIVGVLLVSFVVQNNNLFISQTAKVSQGLSANQASSQISEAIKQASAVAAVCLPPSCSTEYISSLSVLVLTLPAINAAGDVIENIVDYLVISADSSNSRVLRKLVFPNSLSSRKAANQVLATKLLQLKFIYLDSSGNQVSPTSASRVNFTVNLLEKAGFSSEQSSASGQVNLRNN